MFSEFSMRQFVSAFVVLFAVIDVLGSVPIILKLKRKGKKIRAGKIALWSFLMFIGFSTSENFFFICSSWTCRRLRLPVRLLSS